MGVEGKDGVDVKELGDGSVCRTIECKLWIHIKMKKIAIGKEPSELGERHGESQQPARRKKKEE